MTPHDYSLNRFIRQVLYSLKRQFGGTVIIARVLGSTSDPQTGEVTVQRDITEIPRAIILPAKVTREQKQSISIISANKSMVMGGTFDTSTRVFIIDRRDVPDLTLSKDASVLYNGRKYAIDSIEEYEFDSAWEIVGKALIGELTAQVNEATAANDLSLTDTLDGTLSTP